MKKRQMASRNAIIKNRRAGYYPLLTSLCIHVTVFIFLGTIVLNDVPEPSGSVYVQLVKAEPPARKLRRNIPELRSWAVERPNLSKGEQDIVRPVIRQSDVSSYVTTEVIPVFQYESVEMKKPRRYPQTALVRKPLVVSKITTSKPVAHSPRESMFEIHEQLSELSSPYSQVSLPVRSASDSAILQDFLRMVSRRIEKSKRYPGWAIDACLEGKVVVRFSILRDGTLGEEIQLVRSSGAEVLDNAAIATVKKAAPFPTLPRALSLRSLQLELPMDFRLKGS